LAAVRALPWKRILLVAQIVLAHLSEDIPTADRRRLAELVRRSKGDPRRLSRAERDDIVRILRRVELGRLGRDLAAATATTKILKR
jgi:hypothetical protein